MSTPLLAVRLDDPNYLLFKDPLAAAAKSAQLAQQLIDEDR